jgi:tetratricopeptide (TPR) repeat protein
MAEGGEKSERVLGLLVTALSTDPDAREAATLHHAIGLCHERQRRFARASREHAFAARLLLGLDSDRALELRARAADNLFRAGTIEAAAEEYRLISGLEAVSAELRSWTAFQLGNCYYRSRRYAMAADTYDSLRMAHPTSFWSEQAEARLAAISRSGAVR